MRAIETFLKYDGSLKRFWPGSDSEFGLVSFHSCNHLLGRPPHFGDQEREDALHAQAMLAGYASCHGQASYQGFSTFNEITYPLISQHVVTDGRQFSFYVYQLNTTLMNADHVDTNPRVNVCHAMPAQQLYQHIIGNEFVGWDDSALRMLILFYMNKPEQRDYDMKPNVDKSESHVKHITDIDERRNWLHNEFRYMYSNRPRHQLPYEIFDWEWIYKIKFMTRPFERRNRPFERWEHPLRQRTYKDYLPKYIPKSIRYPHKPTQENYNTYFPDAFPEEDGDRKL
ncbi:uncharacterized protein LOC120352045 [Nilaparvata lugens]|uniref:uncharacterized protein LOC120352045 n=1 Tax=Nilaparvata lugens TaxID=108931 RepID=UPI00193D56DE|nr:uncharacterized protein LOC120352045 [Nilaparvata lugens]